MGLVDLTDKSLCPYDIRNVKMSELVQTRKFDTANGCAVKTEKSKLGLPTMMGNIRPSSTIYTGKSHGTPYSAFSLALETVSSWMLVEGQENGRSPWPNWDTESF